MFQPRPWDTSEAVCLSVVELLDVFKDPFLELHFELANFQTISDVNRNTIPLGSSTETITILGKC